MSKLLLHCLKRVNKSNFLLLFHNVFSKQSFETQDLTLKRLENHVALRPLLYVIRNSTN